MSQLQVSIENYLRELEARGDIVITTPMISPIVDGLISSLRHTYEGMYGEGAFTPSEFRPTASTGRPCRGADLAPLSFALMANASEGFRQ